MSKLDYKLTEKSVGTLAAGEAVNVDARGFLNLSVITATGCTATVSRVDSLAASAHTTGNNQFTVNEETLSTTEVDWAFYRISAAAAGLRYALV